MKSLETSVGLFNPIRFTVTNKQNHVEYSGEQYLREEEVRSAIGNMHKDIYDYHYDGYYMHRKKALDRLKAELEETNKKAEELKFAINVLKKKKWERV